MDFLLESFASILLLATKEYLIIPLLTIGYWLGNRDIFARALLLLLFSMTFNVFLKAIWKIPLPCALDTHTWAFPSGHMQAATALWGWLAYEYQKIPCTLAISGLLGGIAWALVFSGYHYAPDVLGGIAFGLGTIFLYAWIIRRAYFKSVHRQPMLGGILLCIAIIMAALSLPQYSHPQSHVSLAIGTLIGTALGWWGRIQCEAKCEKKFPRSAILGSCFLGIAFLYLLFTHIIPLSSFGIVGISVQYCCMSLWILYLCQLPIVLYYHLFKH